MTTGGCLCGGIRFEIHGRLGPMGACHCGMCRKASGSAFAAHVLVRSRYFRLVRGAELVGRHESSPGRFRCFCTRCGSRLGELDLGAPSFPLAAGLLEGELGRTLAGHEWVGSRAPWYRIEDDLPRYPGPFPPLP